MELRLQVKMDRGDNLNIAVERISETVKVGGVFVVEVDAIGIGDALIDRLNELGLNATSLKK